MASVKTGDTVQVHYTGKLQDKTVFDSSEGREPLQFTVGKGQLISGFEQGVIGMTVGETRTLTLPPDEAYGEVRDDLVATIGLDQLPADMSPKVGQVLQVTQPDGDQVLLNITAIDEEEITVDANPPLAGKTLVFDIELVAIA